MKKKHTQGPWQIVDLSQEAHKLAVMDTDKDRIGLFAAIRLESSTPTDEDFANARLIAAAPDMLMALKCAEAALYSFVADYMDEDPKTCNHPAAQAWRECLAAIDKAERGAE